ncbi:hypothetical protein Syun_025879 [Stephania yunnanensis]|uniref:Uncharacterized protein n=1 Tax=Stephania yunnanensis TaxID=152371 RepID=A0AAP0HVP7_9MAGN
MGWRSYRSLELLFVNAYDIFSAFPGDEDDLTLITHLENALYVVAPAQNQWADNEWKVDVSELQRIIRNLWRRDTSPTQCKRRPTHIHKKYIQDVTMLGSKETLQKEAEQCTTEGWQ